ncbi:MarR family winged helix-turn-helix transcriptional regulator [Jannaschia rubra]|uniref:Organic hydroperoxide resistance transcriptional regulator n=1 Tax=Jannaschia rubra TaxID=282197 RepID=A0A0M6XR72_9RHOB|nr:MarR family transcriptional regulator [Jannaschia rubra]CTQ32661.1 Organic hydroperoxide resistance transcriptional regulator [Jannaschia rubra]SFF86945.1 transcriptional regulator, MarR family [Jannaschia rubra]
MTTKEHAATDLALDRQLCFPLYAASNLLTRLYRQVLAPLDLTYPQYLVMLVLWESSPQSMGGLGAKLHLDSGTLTPLVKRLAIAGLVERTRDPADERRVLVSLTDRGDTLRTMAADVPHQMVESLAMDRGELEDLRDMLQQFVQVMTASVAVKSPDGRTPDGCRRSARPAS